MTDLGSAVTLQLSDGDKVLEPYKHFEPRSRQF